MAAGPRKSACRGPHSRWRRKSGKMGNKIVEAKDRCLVVVQAEYSNPWALTRHGVADSLGGAGFERRAVGGLFGI